MHEIEWIKKGVGGRFTKTASWRVRSLRRSGPTLASLAAEALTIPYFMETEFSQFQENRYEGQVSLTTKARGRYEGRFNHGRKSGYGTMQYQDGNNWELDLRHGEGFLAREKTASQHVGKVQVDIPHGRGTLSVNNVERKGSWNQGQPLDCFGWKIE